MSKKMLINASHPEENRVAIVVDGILSELDIEIAGQEQSKGNIYKAVVVRVETGLQAAFVDYGAEKLGFLQIGEVHPRIYPAQDETKSRPRIADILQRGQEILVQIVKEERGNKGAALTTFLSIPGRYMVLMPDSSTKGVSRKISVDSERKSLKRTMAELELPERMGYIVRTAGIGKDKDELKRDFDYLVRLFEGIIARKDQIKAPAQLYQESNLAIRSIRDYFSTEMDEVLVDDHKVFQDTKDFFSLVMPELKHLVKRHRERRPIFSRYQIEEQIDGLSKNQAPLPSGGSIVLDQTEALVAIDVNSGKMSGESGIEATAFKTNFEAATEIGRQLRLRDLGGLIVIDFIDMRDRKNIREIEQEMRRALKDDKAKVSVGRISQFGLLEMSRQRLKPVLSVGAYLECPHCKGIGKIKSVEAQAVSFLRQAHTAAAKGQIGHIEANVPFAVANYLLNQKRSTITELERQLNLKISLLGQAHLLPGDLELTIHKREAEATPPRQIMPVSHENQIEIALAAAQLEEQEPQEQVKETATDEKNETVSGQDDNEEIAEKPKKRRRRRRKKPASSDQETQGQDQQEQNGETPAETILIQQDSAPATAEKATHQETEQTQEQNKQQENEKPAEEKPKPRPRRRSRKKTTAAVDATTEATSASGQVEAKETKVEEKPATETTNAGAEKESVAVPAVEKPKRRPRRTTKKGTDTSTEAAPEEQETKEKKPVEAKEEIPADSQPKPKPRRTSRKTTKKADSTTETAATVTDVTEEKPKPRRRRTTKKASESAPASTEATSEVKSVEEEKPKRRPRKTTKKAPEAIAKTSSEATDISTNEEKPKPKPRTRRAPAKKKPVEVESPVD
ncbi:Rne/Rng family ribonuclease [uncultured Desulfuromusa sp.]|uniref:Rne/Rng family ribonuclease n=1 Tax=uncultured Desulfuromusa sp. TaxID=219183 RepID=UPI002AA65179|nr:Rne/Rng family ribonuclease [uncultured Desulfuromusa sp.]